MQDLGKFKGCAYAKFDYDPYKIYWVYMKFARESNVRVRSLNVTFMWPA